MNTRFQSGKTRFWELLKIIRARQKVFLNRIILLSQTSRLTETDWYENARFSFWELTKINVRVNNEFVLEWENWVSIELIHHSPHTSTQIDWSDMIRKFQNLRLPLRRMMVKSGIQMGIIRLAWFCVGYSRRVVRVPAHTVLSRSRDFPLLPYFRRRGAISGVLPYCRRRAISGVVVLSEIKNEFINGKSCDHLEVSSCFRSIFFHGSP